jgi:hypothetical protein
MKASRKTRWTGLSLSIPFSRPIRNSPCGMRTIAGILREDMVIKLAVNPDPIKIIKPYAIPS